MNDVILVEIYKLEIHERLTACVQIGDQNHNWPFKFS